MLFLSLCGKKAGTNFDFGVETAKFLRPPAGDNSQSFATGIIFFGGGVTSRALCGGAREDDCHLGVA